MGRGPKQSPADRRRELMNQSNTKRQEAERTRQEGDRTRAPGTGARGRRPTPEGSPVKGWTWSVERRMPDGTWDWIEQLTLREAARSDLVRAAA